MEWEIVIGLEAHAQLATRTKLFCGCSTQFGAEPNAQCCPVCLGLPGVLPVLNRRAFEYGLKTALALQCEIPDFVVFDRKNYYYPDLPKNYQISQNYRNLGTNGRLVLPLNGGRVVRIHNVHLEEDAGKLIHPEGRDLGYSLVDLNRSGVPLVEIVTEPDLRSVAEAEVYMNTLAAILQYLGVSECKMQEGSLRLEASISLRERGSDKLGNRVEIKNLNSFKAVLKSLEYEIGRQRRLLEKGQPVSRETRLWNEERGTTEPMRSKELAHDYRYFPEPDLRPVTIPRQWLDEIRSSLPELPHIRKSRFVEDYALPEYDAAILTADRHVADFFEECVRAGSEPKAVSNWVLTEVLRYLNEKKLTIREIKLRPSDLVELIGLVKNGKVTHQAAKAIFDTVLQTGKHPAEVVEQEGLSQISDEEPLRKLCTEVVRKHPKAVEDFKKGKKASFAFLMGQVMRETRGKANPQLVQKILVELLQ